MNYHNFKQIARVEVYDIIIEHIISIIKECLSNITLIKVHIYMNSFTLTEFEKHLQFITKICRILTINFPDKLETCLIYNPPFFISKIYNILFTFIDKKTQQKIKLVTASSTSTSTSMSSF
jgi:S-adenosylmethionine synthetase